MKFSAGKFPNIRFALAAAAVSAAFLLFTAACAQGEAVGGEVAPLEAAAESTGGVPTEQVPAPAPHAAAAEAPVETQASESAIESAGTAVESVAAAPSRVAAASEPAREAASETARKATGAVSSSVATGPASTVVTATGDRTPNLIGEVGQVTAKAAAAVDDQTSQLSGLSESAGMQKVAHVAAFGNPPQAEMMPQPAGTPPSGVPASPGESSLAVSPAFRGKAQGVNADGGALAASYRGFAAAGLSWLGTLESLDGIHSAPMSGTIGTPPDDRTPLDGPTPAPGSSAAAAGSTGSFFVPLAALLALLALVAPATLRRLGQVPAFRPPVPFVCALERPG